MPSFYQRRSGDRAIRMTPCPRCNANSRLVEEQVKLTDRRNLLQHRVRVTVRTFQCLRSDCNHRWEQ